MSKLDLIFDKIKEYKTRGLKPLVVFDLDDTLIDCRYRKRFVLREFCALESSQKVGPNTARRFSMPILKIMNIKFLIF